MDPISFIVSTYINVVSGSTHQRVSEIYGTELQTVVTEYQGSRVTYSYQMWKIKPESICEDVSLNLIDHSPCTKKAKLLFRDVCDHLQANPSGHWRHTKNKNMYCSAAISYKPVVASVNPGREPTQAERARQECNLAIANNLGSTSPAAKHAVKEACREHRAMLD